MVRFSFEQKKCPLCESANIVDVVLVFDDFYGTEEEKLMCRGCRATFSKDFEVETVSFNQQIPEA